MMALGEHSETLATEGTQEDVRGLMEDVFSYKSLP